LMLEANPNLSSRDVKHILAMTAKKIDPNFSGISRTNILPDGAFSLDFGWVKNKAGIWFSNWYGFGAVDASAAVSMAKSYTSYLPAQQSLSSSLHFMNNVALPAPSRNGATMDFTISPQFSTVEQVIVFLSVGFSPGLYCNQIELTSPSGTKSILVHAANGFSTDGTTFQTSISNSRVLSNAFYGEVAAGVWSLKFMDICTPGLLTTTIFSTDNQQLIITGH